LAQARAYYHKAIGQIESLRSLLQSAEFRGSFFEGGLHVYSAMVDVLLASKNPEEAFHYSERARSRVFLDLLGSKVHLSRTGAGSFFDEEKNLKERMSVLAARRSEGEPDEKTEKENLRTELVEAASAYDTFISKVGRHSREQASLMTVEPLKLKEVQALLEPGQTMVLYFVAREKTFLSVVERNRFNAFTLAVSQGDLAAKVDVLRRSIAELKPLREYHSIARTTHDLLIGPALPHIRGKELIIVPHGVLHYLPFQALYSSRGRYLVEDYAVSYLSSASLMQFTKEKRRDRGEKVLALGNPDLGNPSKELKFAELETAEIKKLYPSSTVLLRNGATKIRAKELSSQYDILHFAAHAELNGDDPLSSALLLAKSNGDEGRLQVREVFEMDLNAGLVVLSGCETGLGKLSSGDEFVGLTRAFIYAGTPSVVASLWKVDDASTAHLMSSFYKNLKTKTKVEALRQAQLEMIRGKVSRDLLAQRGVGGVGKLGKTPAANTSSHASVPVSHPYFWAAFVLVGDGQ
jgi:CHAT domain-containing protein